MSIRQIIKYLELKSQLTPEDLAFAERIVGWTESEKEALAGLLQPVKSKSTKPATKRKYERCEVCSLTRRADTHTDKDAGGYHSFQLPQSSSKSKRASSISSAIGGTTGRSATGLPKGAGDGLLCTFEVDGNVCHGSENDGIHDATMGYLSYHEFQPEAAQAASGG